MGVKELRTAFNEVASPTASAMLALLDYQRKNEVESQVLIFSGNYADGAGFVIQSEPLRPNSDLVIASREVAAALLKQRAT